MGYGVFVRKILKRYGKTDKKFAAAIGVTPKQVSEWKRDRQPPKLANLEKMSKLALGVPFDQCLEVPGEIAPLTAQQITEQRLATMIAEQTKATVIAEMKARDESLEKKPRPSVDKKRRGKAKTGTRGRRGGRQGARDE